MKLLIAALSLSILLASCTTTSEVSPEEVQSRMQEIQRTLSVGVTTLEEMTKKYGAPTSIKELADGKIAQWVTNYTVSRTIGSQPVTMEAFDANSSSGIYRHVESKTSTLEALFDAEGILTNFTIK